MYMSSEFGNSLKISVFGESHGKAVGVTIDGLPAGEQIDLRELSLFLDRRRPGRNSLSTKRSETDAPVFLSGVTEGKTNGSPLCAIIFNEDTNSADYSEFADRPRPSHADYTAFIKWSGLCDMRGGGHFSGRLTAPICIAGGVAKQVLSRRNIFVGAHLASVAQVSDTQFPLIPSRELFDRISAKSFPVIDDEKGSLMQAEITSAASDSDSVGGIVECAVIGLPPGIGSPMFGGVENRLSAAIFGIPAVKGLEFGAGFECAKVRGSQNNDPFIADENGRISTDTNNCGGILGGITNGMPVLFRTAFKPTPSIGITQNTVSLSRLKNVKLKINGRHDPCIAHRAVPVIEAATALVILDLILEGN